jgi:hypothetical protein
MKFSFEFPLPIRVESVFRIALLFGSEAMLIHFDLIRNRERKGSDVPCPL